MTAEATLRAAILKRIRDDYPPRKSGVLVFGRPAGAGTGAGHPDLFGVALSRFFALEIKLPKGKATPVQEQRILDLRMCGAYAWVIHSTLDATRAVFVAKRGGPVPMANEPIDFDDWFKSVINEAPAATEERPKTSEDMLTEPEPEIVDSTGVVLDLSQPAPDILDLIPTEATPPSVEDPTPRPTVADLPDIRAAIQAQAEPSAESLAEMPEVTPEQWANAKPNRFVPSVTTTAGGAYPSWEVVLEHITRLDADIRTVGDRVTLLYEAVNRVETLLRSRHVLLGQIGEEVIRLSGVINKLLTEVQADDLVAPTLVDEPTPLDDVLPPEEEAPKRGRGRPRKAS